MEDFSDLPDEIIDDFARRLHNIEDFIKFGTVCKSCQSAAIAISKELKEKQSTSFSCFSPWMMLATCDNDNDPHEGIQKFFSISNKRVFDLELPYTQGRMCWGSPFGWMVTIDIDHNIHIFNPLSGFQFSLPQLSTFGLQYLNKAENLLDQKSMRSCSVDKLVISSAPSVSTDKSFIVVAIAIQTDFWLLFVTRLGDEAWTSVDAPRTDYVDAIFYNDLFFAIDVDGVLVICDINTSYPTASRLCSPPEHFHYVGICYLVEMSGDLALIERIYVDVQNSKVCRETKEFYVYKLDFHTRSWTELSDLGDNALFIGNNTSFAISPSDLSDFELKRNCIYFTGEHPALEGHHDHTTGIFDYGKKTVELLYEGDDMLSDISQPAFFLPSL